MAVFVTGGTGFLGQSLVRTLRARGREVRVLVRPRSDTRGLESERIETFLGDLDDPPALRAGMRRAEAVVHAAILADSRAPRAALEETNVRGLRNVLDAALKLGIPRVLYVSSHLALGPSRGEVADESRPPLDERNLSDRERSLRAADRIAATYASGGLPLTVVYPTVLYGPGPLRESNLVSRLLTALFAGRAGAPPDCGDRRWSLAYVEDVAAGVCRALDRGARGDRYLLGGENVSVPGFWRVLSAILGGSPGRPRASGGFWSRLAGRREDPWREIRDLLRRDRAFSSARAQERLGYHCRPLREGLSRTVEWLGRRGLLVS